MLIGIDPLLGPDCLAVLRAMGHGDHLVLADANFPAASSARRLVRMDGAGMLQALGAVLSVLPIDDFEPEPLCSMQVVGDPSAVPPKKDLRPTPAPPLRFARRKSINQSLVSREVLVSARFSTVTVLLLGALSACAAPDQDPLSYDEFKATLEETKATVMEIIGPERTEGAAGSIYATLPVVVRVDLKDGTRHNYAGQYVVKRVNDVPGATPEQLRWHIESADLRELR